MVGVLAHDRTEREIERERERERDSSEDVSKEYSAVFHRNKAKFFSL